MKKHSLIATARHLLAHAATASSGRSAETVYGGHEHVLRHTLIALMQGRSLAEHDSEGEATIYVIHGRVRLSTDDAHWDGMTGDLLELPPSRHRLDALEDSAILLSVVKPEALDSADDRDKRR
ncbi:MAG TPA: LuxR family transcriptional regulator [Mycobacterium sp.]|jgi:quercetin dioxygenase-like cupin family protein|uniref:LuxR family transcriptional regulator n=1 Tax=Mycolicibacterium llatzerense TaxID=280871 RepID=UPI0008DE09ED|nr:LuxR family transcriptional regulator [Mycolicibacterium llatzerense]MCW1959243.1 LuxR family transcriptional regulator [Mycobacterium sp.]TXI42759.1 MAG: LuxR family transcriptional regulator [Mycobacterium sp.]HNM83328.1 LuxR family transcriptional regulator [Mycobacterium sp.]HPX37986.1 LuxR family transcriptional regulator [Mycobacterium sp.]HQC78397.1 LuxR family transcriptional regulator [Mycobacterium sp.]